MHNKVSAASNCPLCFPPLPQLHCNVKGGMSTASTCTGNTGIPRYISAHNKSRLSCMMTNTESIKPAAKAEIKSKSHVSGLCSEPWATLFDAA